MALEGLERAERLRQEAVDEEAKRDRALSAPVSARVPLSEAPAAPTPSEPRGTDLTANTAKRLAGQWAPAVPLTSGSEGEARIAEISSRLEAWRAFRASLTEENVCDEPQSFAELALEAHAGSDIAYLLTALASARSALDAKDAEIRGWQRVLPGYVDRIAALQSALSEAKRREEAAPRPTTEEPGASRDDGESGVDVWSGT